jgi:sugar lactone lactonase YvrE
MRIPFGPLGAAAVVAVLGSASPSHAGSVPFTVVAALDVAELQTPESIAIDRSDNIYLSLALTGEILKIAPDGTRSSFATMPLGGPPFTPCGGIFGLSTGLALDHQDNLYVNVASCDPASRGVWKVAPDGTAQILATLPMTALPNGLAYDSGQLYVADSFGGVVWRVAASGGAPAEVWSADPLLGNAHLGANGIQVYQHGLYVSNTGLETIVSIPFAADGSPGPATVHATGVACDDLALDVHGNIYCAGHTPDSLVRIAPDGSSQVLLTAADGLQLPTAAAFGRSGADQQALYLTNGAYPFAVPPPQHPSLMRVEIGVPGYPRP